MIRLARPLSGVLVAVIAAGSLCPTAAVAAPSGQTADLCEGAGVTCSIQVPPVVPESSVTRIVVTGRAGATVEVQARRVELRNGTPAGMVAFGPSARITVDADGFGAADLSLPTLPDGEPGGPLLFTLGDAAGTDLDQLLGTWSVLAARTPHLQGDGYARQKPAGEPLELRLDSALAGTSFQVEYADAQGTWHGVSDPATGRCGDPQQTCTVTYTVPRGLAGTDHAFRLVNLASGVGVANWAVQPSQTPVASVRETVGSFPSVGGQVAHSITWSFGATSNPVPQPRQANLDVPDVGSKVHWIRHAGDATVTVLHVGYVVAGIALACALAGVIAGVRRRLRPRLAREEVTLDA